MTTVKNPLQIFPKNERVTEIALYKCEDCEVLIDFFSTYLKNMAKSPVIQSKVIRIILLFLYTSNQ